MTDNMEARDRSEIEVPSQNLVEGLRKIRENLFRIAAVLGEIQTRTHYSILNHLSPTLFNLSS